MFVNFCVEVLDVPCLFVDEEVVGGGLALYVGDVWFEVKSLVVSVMC